jgi:hypothetical protein
MSVVSAVLLTIQFIPFLELLIYETHKKHPFLPSLYAFSLFTKTNISYF